MLVKRSLPKVHHQPCTRYVCESRATRWTDEHVRNPRARSMSLFTRGHANRCVSVVTALRARASAPEGTRLEMLMVPRTLPRWRCFIPLMRAPQWSQPRCKCPKFPWTGIWKRRPGEKLAALEETRLPMYAPSAVGENWSRAAVIRRFVTVETNARGKLEVVVREQWKISCVSGPGGRETMLRIWLLKAHECPSRLDLWISGRKNFARGDNERRLELSLDAGTWR